MIKTLLVANRGEIARRVIRTARSMGIRTVAVFSEPDSRTPHVAAADTAIALGGSSAAESYLDSEKILRAAAVAGADAIHPGYGFLSENAGFAKACADAGITFVGPSPEAVETMGLKDRAKEVARRAGVPVLPDARISGGDPGVWRKAADTVGYPLLVKATAGGGGKGMRRVDDPEGLKEAIETARREAASSFGNPDVFVERYLTAPRHVEIQVFGDRHGNAVYLHERECSVQRRHQKVIEEAPSPAVSAALRARMGETAVALVRELGYAGAGTVEYLLDDGASSGRGSGNAAGDFYFLEMNTRLQVEHPVTEEITGLDLVRLQLQVAAGEPLGFGQEDVRIDGHAIEVRLYAEDPARDFAPAPGIIHRYSHHPGGRPPGSTRPGDIPRAPGPGWTADEERGYRPSGSSIRFEDGIGETAEISPFYDPMIAKVIAHAPTRAEASLTLARALAATELHGTATNLAFVTAALTSDAFLAGETRTDFIDRHPDLKQASAPTPEHVHLAAAVAVSVARRRQTDQLTRPAPPGFRLLPGHPDPKAVWSPLGSTGTDGGTGANGGSGTGANRSTNGSAGREIAYRLSAAAGDAELRLTVDGTRHDLRLSGLTVTDPAGGSGSGGGTVRVRDGAREWPCRVAVHTDGSVWVNDPGGQRGWQPQPRLPDSTAAGGSGPVSDMAGVVVAVKVKPGDQVTAGQRLVVVEAMKMEWPTVAGQDGTIDAVLVTEGEYVEAKKVLVTFA